jgi:hypothetical protein
MRRIEVLKQQLSRYSGAGKVNARFDFAIRGIRQLAYVLLIATLAAFMIRDHSAAVHAHLAGFADALSGTEYSSKLYTIERWFFQGSLASAYLAFTLALSNLNKATSAGFARVSLSAEQELKRLLDNFGADQAQE